MLYNTVNHAHLSKPKEMQKCCKSLAVLDAILSPEWEYRYYSYNAHWNTAEAVFQMQDGSGDAFFILFQPDGAVINGFAHELYDFEENLPNKNKLTQGLPERYSAFIFGEPVSSTGTTYCLWTDEQQAWTLGEVEYDTDGSADQLFILDGNPQTYLEWALDYHWDGEEEEITPAKIHAIQAIYKGETLTKDLVLALNSEFEDWQQLQLDLQQIQYPNALS